MTTAHFQTLLAEHVAQHAAAGERIAHVQLVDASHQQQVGAGDWLQTIVNRGAADLQQLRLSADGQLELGMDHCLALSSPALMSAVSRKKQIRLVYAETG